MGANGSHLNDVPCFRRRCEADYGCPGTIRQIGPARPKSASWKKAKPDTRNILQRRALSAHARAEVKLGPAMDFFQRRSQPAASCRLARARSSAGARTLTAPPLDTRRITPLLIHYTTLGARSGRNTLNSSTDSSHRGDARPAPAWTNKRPADADMEPTPELSSCRDPSDLTTGHTQRDLSDSTLFQLMPAGLG